MQQRARGNEWGFLFIPKQPWLDPSFLSASAEWRRNYTYGKNGYNNNNNNHLFYIALLKTLEVALQFRVQ